MAKRIRKPPVNPGNRAPDPAVWQRDKSFGNREAWLFSAIWGSKMMPGAEPWCLANRIYATTNVYVPQNVRAVVGWPFGSGNKRWQAIKADTIGQCFNSRSSTKGYTEMFLSPMLGLKDGVDPTTATVSMLSTLTHELVHAMDDGQSGHGGWFIRASRAIGLESADTASKGVGTFKRTVTTPEYRDWLVANIIKRLGPIPHAALRAPPPKDTNRYVKLVCPRCKMIIRTTRAWLEESGSPKCNCGGGMFRVDQRDPTNANLDLV